MLIFSQDSEGDERLEEGTFRTVTAPQVNLCDRPLDKTGGTFG